VSVIAVVIVVAVIALARPGAPRSADELVTPTIAYPAGIVDGDGLGAATAPVVIELYADFQCPACRLFVTTELPRLLTDFVVPGTVRIAARDIDILGTGMRNESLELAAGAACAARQDRYWAFHDLVFWNQLRENRGDYDAAFIGRIADAAGVDRAAWDACVAGNDVRPAIVSRSSAAAAAGIRSTPTLVVNGQVIVGVPDYETLAALIRRLAAAPSAPAAVTGSSAPAPSAPASTP